jgi:hypothetical protein
MKPSVFRRQYALPQDHGAWVFILSPLLIGLFAGKSIDAASVILVAAVMCAFLIRQPVTMLIKIRSGRRNRRDLPAVIFWTSFYAVIGSLAVFALVLLGYGYILYLAIPGIPVFAWHLALVSRRAERRQAGIEIVASGVLALSAPGAYWVGIDGYDPAGWWLFLLTWIQSAASIVYAYLRLEQRELPESPNTRTRFRLGYRALLYTSFNLLSVGILSTAGFLPAYLPLAYTLQWAETIWGTTHPAIGKKPTQIGIRQLLVSSLFTFLFILTWNL